MRMGGVSRLTCAVAPVTPLTLSSAVKASLFGMMSWRCLAQSEHGIAGPRTWHALGGFRQCGTESQSNDALVRSAPAIHSTADQGSVVAPPSHGGNTGSSLVLSTMTTDLNGETLEDAVTELD